MSVNVLRLGSACLPFMFWFCVTWPTLGVSAVPRVVSVELPSHARLWLQAHMQVSYRLRLTVRPTGTVDTVSWQAASSATIQAFSLGTVPQWERNRIERIIRSWRFDIPDSVVDVSAPKVIGLEIDFDLDPTDQADASVCEQYPYCTTSYRLTLDVNRIRLEVWSLPLPLNH